MEYVMIFIAFMAFTCLGIAAAIGVNIPSD